MLKALGLLLKWLFLKKPDQSKGPTLKERDHQTVRADQESEIHRGPKGGLYRIDAKGRKVYLKASEQPKQGKPRRAKRRRTKTAYVDLRAFTQCYPLPHSFKWSLRRVELNLSCK